MHGWAYRPHLLVMKMQLLENALQTGEIWKRRLFVFVWRENILQTEFVENDDVTIIMWLPSQSFTQRQIQNPKSIVTRSHAFSRAFRQLHVITTSFDWFTGFSASSVIGQSDYFGFGFTTLNPP